MRMAESRARIGTWLALAAALVLSRPGPAPAQDPLPDLDTWLATARSHSSAGRYEEARALLRRVGEFPEVPAVSIEPILDEFAIAALGSLDLEGAVAGLFSADGSRPTWADPDHRALLAWAAGEPERAVAEFLADAWRPPSAHRDCIRVFLVTGDPAILTHADPREGWADALLGWLRGERTDAAIDALATEPDLRAELDFVRGMLARRADDGAEDTAAALDLLDRAIAAGDGRSLHVLWARIARAQLRGELPAFSLPPPAEARTGRIDRTGELIVPARYDWVSVDGDRFIVSLPGTLREGVIDRAGRWRIAPVFASLGPLSAEGLASGRTRHSPHFGAIGPDGAMAIAPAFLELASFSSVGGIAEATVFIAGEGERIGFLRSDGTWATPPSFLRIAPLAGEGLHCALRDWKAPWVFVDPRDGSTLPAEFRNESRFSEGLAPVQPEEDGPFGFIDRTGALVIPPRFASAGGFSEGLAAVQEAAGDAFGYIDRTGAFVISPRFSDARPFSEGRAVVVEAGAGGEGGVYSHSLIDRSGERVGELRFYARGGFREGAIPVQLGEGRLASSWAFAPWLGRDASAGRTDVHLDLRGIPITERRFDEVGGFSEGLAAARIGPFWGYLDPSGEWAILPRFAHAGNFEGGTASVELLVPRPRLHRFTAAEFEGAAHAEAMPEVLAEEALLDELEALPARLSTLRARVPRAPAAAPLPIDRAACLATLRRFRDLLASDDAGRAYDELLTPECRAEDLALRDDGPMEDWRGAGEWMPPTRWRDAGVPALAARAFAVSEEAIRAEVDRRSREFVARGFTPLPGSHEIQTGPILLAALLEHSAELRAFARERFASAPEREREGELTFLTELIAAIESGDDGAQFRSSPQEIWSRVDRGIVSLVPGPEGLRISSWRVWGL